MKKILLVLSVLLLAVGVANANLINNGSFEVGNFSGAGFDTFGVGNTNLNDWSIFTGNIDVVLEPYWDASDGVRSIDLNGNMPGGIQQGFATSTGNIYDVSFMLAGNPQGGGNVKISLPSAAANAGVFTFDTTGATETNMNWTKKSFQFKAISNWTVLKFESLTYDPLNAAYFGPVIDNVNVSSVPEPSTIAGLLACLPAGILFMRKKRG